MLKTKMMKRKRLFVLCLILGPMICLPAQAIIIDNVVVTPSNIVMPTLPGDTFSFDLIIDDPAAAVVLGFQSTFSVSGSGLTFEVGDSEAVENDQDYWIAGNSGGAMAIADGSNSYTFSDYTDNALPEALGTDDLMARYSFTWDGTEGDYTFSFDFDIAKSFVTNEGYESQALKFKDPDHPELGDDASSFTVTIIPEPATLILMCLGTVVLRRKRRVP